MVQLNDQFDKGGVDIQLYTEVYFEWCKMFGHLGKALAVAFSDIHTKATDIRNNHKMVLDNYQENLTL